MPHAITYNSDTHVVGIKVHGDVLLDEIKEIYSEAMQTAKDNDSFLFFSDYSESRIRLSTLEIYELPEVFSDIAAAIGFNPRELKRAIIPSQRSDDFDFFETVSSNRGQNRAKIFRNVQSANKWLAEK